MLSNPDSSNSKSIGVFTLAMISISAMIALRNLPSFAKNGFGVVLILGVSALLFFIPISLVCAELASGWPKKGGLYAWVKEAFGERAGAVAIWLEWIESVVWLPTVLSFIATTLSYTFNPELQNNTWYMSSLMLTFLWTGTIVNFLSTKTSGFLSAAGIILGSLIPGVAIILLGGLWVSSGQPIHIDFSVASLTKDLSINSFSYFIVTALGFAGVEVAAFYVQDTKNPKRTFPLATLFSASTILAIYMLGALAIAIVIPSNKIELAGGMMQALQEFFGFFKLNWLVPIFAGLSAIGGLALLNTWIIGPSQGLLASAQNGDLPKFASKQNKKGSPVNILLMQGVVGSFLILMKFFIPTGNQFYWFFQIQAGQLIVMMYLLVFLSVIKLRYSQPDVKREYTIPGGKPGIWVIGGFGSIFCIVAFLMGFMPPEEFKFAGGLTYGLILLGGIVVFSAPPFIWGKKLKDN